MERAALRVQAVRGRSGRAGGVRVRRFVRALSAGSRVLGDRGRAGAQQREVLRDVDGALRSQAVFGVLPPSAPAAPTQGTADANIVPVIVDV